MIRRIISTSALIFCAVAALADPVADYAEHCAECHGPARLGAIGPALIPETLGRMRGPNLEAVIRDGRPATQMPAFTSELDADRIAAIAAYLGEPLAEMPQWGEAEITASRVLNPDYKAAQAGSGPG